MPRPRLLFAALLALLALAPAAVAAPSPAAPAPAAVLASDGEDPGEEDPGDEWAAEDPGDEWTEDWGDDGELCDDEEWVEAEIASDDEAGEDWGDEEDFDESWVEDPCADEADEAAAAVPARLSVLRATPGRNSSVRVSFRLDRGSSVTLALRRLGGARASGRPRAVRGRVTVHGRKGANETTLRRWKGRPLQPGAYRLTATPDTAGSRGATAAFTLRIAARRR